MDIDTDKMIQDFTRSARTKGARIVTGARIDAIERRDGRWLLGWPGGAEEAEILVNAAGSWADRIAVLAGARPQGLQPYRRSVAQIPAPEGRDCSGWPLFEGAGMEWYARPSGGKLWISPAEEDPMDPHDAFTDDMVVAEGLARYGDMVQVPVTRVETTWAGLRTFAPDRALVIGPDPGLPGFWWCAGQGGYGFQTAPAASRLLAQLIGGAAPELDADTVAALSPVRFS
jgi:glycine/D-amino acid oxidase-like deaminating enzyme